MGFFAKNRDNRRRAREMAGGGSSWRTPGQAADETGAALDTMEEIAAKAAEMQRLQREGIRGQAEIVAVREDVRVLNGMPRHEIVMEVRLPDREPYRATREVALALDSVPWFVPGAVIAVAADRDDPSDVVITQNL